MLQPPPAVVPVVVPQRRNLSPLLFGIPCLALILFLIAATIVLSLIPVYISSRYAGDATRTRTDQIVYVLPNGTVLFVGPLNANQQAILQNYLQEQVNNNPQTRGATVTVISAVANNNNQRRKRQQSATASFLTVIVRITCRRSINCAEIVLNFLRRLSILLSFLEQLVSLQNNSGTTTTTTTTIPILITTTTIPTLTTTTANSSTNETRVLARRSLKEGGAPSSLTYIDFHQMASVKGNVSSVSFYVDRSCALATIEFGAFELINRDIQTDAAQLVLAQRSGLVKLGAATDLKPYMNHITIRLCTGKIFDDIKGDGCQGTQFLVLPHQYIGIRSDTCRLGFAESISTSQPVTTWTHREGLDPFAEPYQTLNYVLADHTILQTVTIESSESDNYKQINERKINNRFQPNVLFLGSYPPRQCGLAAFLEDLTDNYPGPHSVVSIDEQGTIPSSRDYSDKVVFRLNQTDRDSYYTIADMVNSKAYDVINVQHEYGLFGGMGGEYIVALLAAVRKPVIVTMHTVPSKPSAFYLSLTRAIIATSTRVIVLSDLGQRMLIDVYGISGSKILVVPHGVPDIPFAHTLADAKTQLGFPSNVPIITTFGLISRNKNIQFVLKALPEVIKSVPNALYLILGETHPLVKQYEGEAYREGLEYNVTQLGLSKNVRFINKFLDDNELLAYLKATDVYLTPYAQEDQYVSGTLSWAVGMGKAVVSTPYLYAKELLADGRGFLVPFEDDQFLQTTITALLKDDGMRNRARRSAYDFGRQMTWPTVANKLEDIFRELLLFTQ